MYLEAGNGESGETENEKVRVKTCIFHEESLQTGVGVKDRPEKFFQWSKICVGIIVLLSSLMILEILTVGCYTWKRKTKTGHFNCEIEERFQSSDV